MDAKISIFRVKKLFSSFISMIGCHLHEVSLRNSIKWWKGVAFSPKNALLQ